MGRFGPVVNSANAYVTALIFCEKVITEARTGLDTLVSAFERLQVQTLPSRMPQFFVYVAIARGESDESEFYFAIISPNGEVVVKGGFRVENWGALHWSAFILPLAEVPLPTAGLYVVRVFAPDRVLMERYIDVRISPQSPAGQDNSPTSEPSP